MIYLFLADILVAIHVLYVGFVVLGQAAIVCGILCKWEWVRNWWFRLAHLLAIVIVALESLAEIACPLTVWEDQLRALGGKEVSEDTFVARLIHPIFFYNFPPWVFTTCYVGFAVLVLATFWLAPPRRRKSLGERGT